jgi:hypothetical protein
MMGPDEPLCQSAWPVPANEIHFLSTTFNRSRFSEFSSSMQDPRAWSLRTPSARALTACSPNSVPVLSSFT